MGRTSSSIVGAAILIAASSNFCGSADAQIRVRARSGVEVVVSGLKLDDDRLRGTSAGAVWSLPLRDLWVAMRPGASRAATGSASAKSRYGAAFVHLRKGARLAGKFVGARAAADGHSMLRFALELGAESEVPLRHVQAIRFSAKDLSKVAPKVEDAKKKTAKPVDKKPQAPSDEGFLVACETPPKNRDLLFVQVRGKLRRVPCRVEKITEKDGKISIVTNRGAVGLETVYGLVLGEISGIEAEKIPSDRRVMMQLRDGRRIEGSLRDLDASKIEVVLDEGFELRLMWSQLIDLELSSERLVYLSDLPLAEGSRSTPALGRVWPLLRDSAPGGGTLRLGKRNYRRGFFVIPPRRMLFELPRKFDRLKGEVGMLASRFGAAKLTVYAGDRKLGETIELAADGRARPIDIELGKASQVRIELDVGASLDSGARVVLGDLRVIAD